MVRLRINIIDKLSIHNSILERQLRVLVMRKVQPLKVVVFVLAVNLLVSAMSERDTEC